MASSSSSLLWIKSSSMSSREGPASSSSSSASWASPPRSANNCSVCSSMGASSQRSFTYSYRSEKKSGDNITNTIYYQRNRSKVCLKNTEKSWLLQAWHVLQCCCEIKTLVCLCNFVLSNATFFFSQSFQCCFSRSVSLEEGPVPAKRVSWQIPQISDSFPSANEPGSASVGNRSESDWALTKRAREFNPPTVSSLITVKYTLKEHDKKAILRVTAIQYISLQFFPLVYESGQRRSPCLSREIRNC